MDLPVVVAAPVVTAPVLAAPDWAATAQAAFAALSWLVALVSVGIAWSEHRERRRGETAARVAAERLEEQRIQAERDLLEARKAFELELLELRARRAEAEERSRRDAARAERVERQQQLRRDRARLVAAAWGNDRATAGDTEPPGGYGVLVHNRTDLVIRYANVTVSHRAAPHWHSKESLGTLSPQSCVKVAAAKLINRAWGDVPPGPVDPGVWERRSSFQVELTFVDGEGFWLHDRDGVVHELPSNLVIWAEEQRARALRKHIEEGFTPEYGVRVRLVGFPDVWALQAAFNALPATGATSAEGAAPDGADRSPDGVPDVLVGPHDWLGQILAENRVAEVRLTAGQALSFHPKALQTLRRAGRLYAIPYVFDSVALLRNTALAGSGPFPATFEELVACGAALCGQGDVTHPVALQVGPAGDPYQLWPVFASAGGTLFGLRPDGDADPPQVWREGFEAAFVRLSELGERGHGVLRTDIGRAEAMDLFRSGRTPFLVCSSRGLVEADRAGMAVDAAPVPPLGDLPARSMVSTYGFFVHRGARNRRIAEDLVTHYLARTETGERLAEIQPRPPVQTDAARRVAATDPRVGVYVAQCEAGMVMPNNARMAELWALLGQAQADVIRGADPVPTARRAADQGWAVVRGIVD